MFCELEVICLSCMALTRIGQKGLGFVISSRFLNLANPSKEKVAIGGRGKKVLVGGSSSRNIETCQCQSNWLSSWVAAPIFEQPNGTKHCSKAEWADIGRSGNRRPPNRSWEEGVKPQSQSPGKREKFWKATHGQQKKTPYLQHSKEMCVVAHRGRP